MSTTTSFAVPILFLSLFGGLVGGAVSGALLPSDLPPDDATEAPDQILVRLDEMSDALARLAERVHRLEVAPPLPSASPASALPDTAVVTNVPVAPVAAPALRDEQLEEKILDVLKEREQTERAARDERRAESEARRTTEFLDRLESEMGLDSYRREKLTELLTTRREAVEALRERMRTADDDQRNQIREEMRALRDESDRQIKELLTPEQYKAYEEQREQRGGGRRGRGGGESNR